MNAPEALRVVELPGQSAVKPLMATALMAVVVLAMRFQASALQLNGMLSLLASVLVGAAVYFGVVFMHYRHTVKAWREASAIAES